MIDFTNYNPNVDKTYYDISDNKVICYISENSKRLVHLRLAKLYIDLYSKCNMQEKKDLIKPINFLKDAFDELLKKTREIFNNQLIVIYDDKTKKVIDQLEVVLKENIILK